MSRRPDDFDLRAALRAVNFTPRVQDVPALIALLAGEDESAQEEAAQALGRMDAAARPILAQAEAAPPPLRARLCRVAGRLAQRGVAEARTFLLARLRDSDDLTRKAAIIALGALGALDQEWGEEAEAALLEAWSREQRPEHRRALAAALGKVGGGRAAATLSALDTDDGELRRITDRALLMLGRTEARQVPSRTRLDRTPEGPLRLLGRCRPGVEGILAEELTERLGVPARPEGPGVVSLRWGGAPQALLRARTLVQLAFPVAVPAAAPGADPAAALADALTAPAARAVFSSFTEGAPRFRLAFAAGGHRRGLIWRCAALVQARCPELRNDPTDSTWEAVVIEGPGGELRGLELRPRHLPDDRFAYRKDAVPAASHPTLAAALARVGGAEPGDVVWDPFVGSGLELAERARLGPYQALLGTDLDARALAAARANLSAAGVADARLVEADACAFPVAPTLILTNPPMGRRVARDGSLGALLDRFVDHAAEVLRPGGRLVWLSPLPRRTEERLQLRGLRLTLAQDVDMGGFTAQLQRAERR